MNLKELSTKIEQTTPKIELKRVEVPISEIFPEVEGDEKFVFEQASIASQAWAMKDAEEIQKTLYPEATPELVQSIALIAVCHKEPSDNGMPRAQFYVSMARDYPNQFAALVNRLDLVLRAVTDESVSEKKIE
jgi:hypothetical protein